MTCLLRTSSLQDSCSRFLKMNAFSKTGEGIFFFYLLTTFGWLRGWMAKRTPAEGKCRSYQCKDRNNQNRDQVRHLNRNRGSRRGRGGFHGRRSHRLLDWFDCRGGLDQRRLNGDVIGGHHLA